MRKKFKPILILWLLLAPFSSTYSQRPILFTEDARTLGVSHMEMGVGAEYFTKTQVSAPDVPKSEWRVGVLAAQIGVAQNVDFDLEWCGGLIARTQDGSRGSDWGDLTVATKINIVGEDTALSSLGIRSAVKLPNTSYLPYKLGSDQIDYYVHVLFSRYMMNGEMRMNLGLGIIGNPVAAGSQDDIYLLSTAVIFPTPATTRFFIELYGITGPIADNDKLLVRLGIFTEFLGLQWNAFGSVRVAGNNKDFGTAFEASEDWSGGIFLMKRFQF